MEKVCPVVLRDATREILAFRHPRAGLQIVKGTVEPGEDLRRAALRELFEESGVGCVRAIPMGMALMGAPGVPWHFFRCDVGGLPDQWDHATADDGGHVFSFFWHPLHQLPDAAWHPIFHAALGHIRRFLDA
jgi:8-oxo-dGTP pyrophosphatase MutT (NUDIX family)